MVDGIPVGWTLTNAENYGNTNLYYKRAEKDWYDPKSGENLFTIVADKGATFTWSTKAEVKSYTDYRLATWAAAPALREGNGFNIGIAEIPAAKSETQRWQMAWEVREVFFNSGEHETLTVNMNYTGGRPFDGKMIFVNAYEGFDIFDEHLFLKQK